MWVWLSLHTKFQLPQKSRSFDKIHDPEGCLGGWVAHSGSVESVSQSRVWQHDSL